MADERLSFEAFRALSSERPRPLLVFYRSGLSALHGRCNASSG